MREDLETLVHLIGPHIHRWEYEVLLNDTQNGDLQMAFEDFIVNLNEIRKAGNFELQEHDHLLLDRLSKDLRKDDA